MCCTVFHTVHVTYIMISTTFCNPMHVVALWTTHRTDTIGTRKCFVVLDVTHHNLDRITIHVHPGYIGECCCKYLDVFAGYTLEFEKKLFQHLQQILFVLNLNIHLKIDSFISLHLPLYFPDEISSSRIVDRNGYVATAIHNTHVQNLKEKEAKFD